MPRVFYNIVWQHVMEPNFNLCGQLSLIQWGQRALHSG
jgi:hypothetical protein